MVLNGEMMNLALMKNSSTFTMKIVTKDSHVHVEYPEKIKQVDVEYPKHLRDLRSYLPFLPGKIKTKKFYKLLHSMLNKET